MINRVTNQTLTAAAQRNLQANIARTAELQDRASSLKKINRPSDDPAAAGDAMRLRSELGAVEQYERNIDNGVGWAAAGDAALRTVNETLVRARDLTLQGSNGAIPPAAKEALALELSGLKDDLLGQANTRYLGRTVFAGNSDAGTAFNPDYSWNGSAGSTVERRVGPDETIRVDVDGAEVFGTGADSVFALLDTIVSDLRTGGSVTGHLDSLDLRLDAVINQRTALGTRQARLEKTEGLNLETKHSLEASRARVEDADLAEVILDMNLHDVNYQAALAVTAKVLQPTLMEFLR